MSFDSVKFMSLVDELDHVDSGIIETQLRILDDGYSSGKQRAQLELWHYRRMEIISDMNDCVACDHCKKTKGLDQFIDGDCDKERFEL